MGSPRNAARGEPGEERSDPGAKSVARETREVWGGPRFVDPKGRTGEPREQPIETGAAVSARIGIQQPGSLRRDGFGEWRRIHREHRAAARLRFENIQP